MLAMVVMGSSLLASCGSPAAPVSVWGGFDYRWERLSHRLSFFQSRVGPASPNGAFNAQLGMIGGPWSMSSALPEVVHYRAPWWWVQSDSLQAYAGSVDLDIGPSGLARREIRLSLEAIALDAAEVVTVALAGVSLDMDVPQGPEFPSNYDPAEGWTPQIIGAGVDSIVLAGDDLSFSLWLQFKAGPLDRQDMNEALEFLTIGGSVAYVVLAAAGHYSEAHVEASSWYPIDPPHSDIPAMDVAQRTVVISNLDPLPLALPVIRSWQFVLNSDLDEEGRYLRALAMAIDSFEYHPSNGEARVVLDAYASHSSVIEEGELQVEFNADIGVLQLRSDSSSVVSGDLAGAAAVGPFDEMIVP